MGTILAQTIVNHVAADLLNDANKVRHKETALLAFLNEGQRVIASLRPDACSDILELTLAAGAHQTLPADVQVLISPLHNGTMANPGAAVTPILVEPLDAVAPGWRSGARQSVVKHVIYKAGMATRFQVYPPVVTGTKLCVEAGVIPSNVTLAQPISLDDTFEAPLMNYMLARGHEKSAEYAGDPQRSAMYYSLMREQLGFMAQSVLGANAETNAEAGRK